MEARSKYSLLKTTPPVRTISALRFLSEFAMVLVKTVLDRIHSIHHSTHIRIVQFVTPQKKIIMKKIRVAS